MSGFIFFAVCAANLVAISAGGAWTWVSSILPQLQSPDLSINPLPRPTTTLEDSLIAGAMNLGAVTAPLVGGILCEWIGKKKSMMLLTLPIVVSHMLFIVANNVQMFLVARFLMGITAGAVFVILPGFLSDISEISNRGMFGSLFGVFTTFGASWMYLVGPWLSLRVFSIVNLTIPVVYLVLFGSFVPESPYDLLRKGREELAHQSLRKLRGKGDTDKELAYMKDQLLLDAGETTSIKQLFTSQPLRKALFICNGTMFFQQMSGVCAVVGYMQNIFQSAGNFISPVFATMIIGVVQLLMNFVSSQLIELAGRKVLLIISTILAILSLAVFGSYFYFMLPGYIPIASLVMFIVAFNLGLANIPWVLLSELFPANYKSKSSSITTLFCLSLGFVINVAFPSMNRFLGMAGTFWFFTVSVTVGLGFIVMAVPETKGKSYKEIKVLLEDSRSRLK